MLPGLVLFLLLLAAGRPALATHLLGGEMTYRYLDNNGPAAAPLRYELTVTVYNNCGSTGITAPRASASVGIYDQATGARIILTATNYAFTTTFVGQTGMMSIPQTSLSECISPPIPPGCLISGVSQPYRLQKFIAVVNLPNTSKGYFALFTDGSRNVDVTNLYDPGAQAMTLYVALSPPQIPNHSPVFSDIAVAIICANDTTFLLNNAVDADGDRLVYSFGQPYAATGGLAILPTTFFYPPPPLANYSSGAGYTPTTPFGTSAGNFALLNPSTGLAKYGAATVGRKYAVAVDVQEYRTIAGQEVLIGTTRRDLQLVVASCPTTKAPVLPPIAVTPRDYTIEAGSTLTIPITATQADGHPLAMTLNSVLLDGAGGYNATLDGDPGTVAPGNPTGTAVVSGATGVVTGNFVFATSCADARATPYDVAFTVKDNGCAGKTVADVLHITVVKPKGPTAISGDLLVCGLNATRSYTASGGTTPTVSWRVVGGTIVGSPTANPVQVQWGAAGTGTLVARGRSQYGCPSDSVTRTITISQTATLTATGNLSICRGSSTTLTVAGGTAPYTVSGGPSVITGAGPFTISPTATTTYTITGAAASNTCGATGQVTVTVLPSPAANVGPAAPSTCSGVAIALGAAPVSGSTYSWSPGTGLSSSTVANPTLTLSNTTSAPTTATYTLTETNTTGCQTTNTVTVTVNPLPVAVAGAAATICPGSSAQLGAAPVAGYTYSWSPGTGLSSTTVANPTATLTNTTSAPITQTYTLTTTSAAGCVATAAVTVTVSPPLAAVPGAAAAICSGSSAQLGAAPVAGYTYSWSPGTGLSSATVANPTVTLTNTTSAPITQTYTLTVTNSAGCTGTGTVAVTVNPLPVATPGAAVTSCSGSPVQLGNAPVAGYTYSWSPSTGLSSSTVANPTLTLTNTSSASTTQTYTLTVTNSATGCVGTGTVAVTVNPVVAGGTISASQTVCPGSSPAAFTSTAGASGGPGTYTYQWELSTDNATWTAIPGATDATYAAGPVAVATYYRRQATAATCGTAASNVVAVQLLKPLVTGVALATPPTQCAGTALTFSPVPTNAGSAPTYRWFVNGTQVATGPTYTSATLATGDQVRVELLPSPDLCTSGPATATVTITRTFVDLPTVAISPQTVLPVCSGAPVTFSVDKVTNAGPSPQYQWRVDGVAVAGATTPVFTTTTLRNGQLVTVALQAATVCGSLTVVSNAVRAIINPPVDVDAGPNKEIMAGEQVTLEGKADGTYPVAWTPSLGLTFGSDPLRPVAAPLVTTTYTLSAGTGYCADSSPVTVTVTPRLRIPTAISPNGDGVDDTWEIDNIGAYTGNHVLVFNRWGSKIFDASGYGRSNEWNGTISGQPAPIGTYYYVITLGNGHSYSGPLTVVY
ncbi:gliding motility-associated C-terminal domain-containing protein [Hymenobacter sp. CA2-7]|nr:gliding motility-associated C-terminal domain-containing protein [Hymenobacter sp. CA2-7]